MDLSKILDHLQEQRQELQDIGTAARVAGYCGENRVVGRGCAEAGLRPDVCGRRGRGHLGVGAFRVVAAQGTAGGIVRRARASVAGRPGPAVDAASGL